MHVALYIRTSGPGVVYAADADTKDRPCLFLSGRPWDFDHEVGYCGHFLLSFHPPTNQPLMLEEWHSCRPGGRSLEEHFSMPVIL